MNNALVRIHSIFARKDEILVNKKTGEPVSYISKPQTGIEPLELSLTRDLSRRAAVE